MDGLSPSKRTPTGFFYNALSVSISSLSLRFVGMIFNVYLSNRAGAQAMGLLSLVYSAWGFALTAGCAGGSLASSRLCAECLSTKKNIVSVSKKCLLYSLLCGISVGGLLLLSASFIGKTVLGDSRTVLPLRILALSLPFISMSSSLSGYFSACMRTYKNALVQLTEQFFRIVITVALFTSASPSGAKSACVCIVCGGALAEILSFLMLYIIFIFDRRKNRFGEDEPKNTFRSIAEITVPIAFSASLRSALVSIEHVLVPRGLIKHGLSSEGALSLFGTVHGMALPVILFCHAIPSSFSSLLVPRFAEYNAAKNKKEVLYVASRAYRASLCFALGISAFLTLSGHLLGNALYPDTETGRYIYLLAPLIPIMYVDSVSDALLKGVGEQLSSMKINIIDALISLSAVFLLVPKAGIWGYIFAIYVSELFNTCASLYRVNKILGFTLPSFRYIILPLACAVTASKATYISYRYLSWLSCGFLVGIGAVLFLLLYITILKITKTVNKEESDWIKKVVFAGKSKKQLTKSIDCAIINDRNDKKEGYVNEQDKQKCFHT